MPTFKHVKDDDLLFNVKAHGVKGDGTTDDTLAIQDLIDAGTTAGGRTLYFPPGSYRITNLTLKAGVVLQGAQGAFGYGPSGRGSCKLVATPAATGIMIDATGANCGVMNLDVIGNASAGGATGVTTGIRSSGNWCKFTDIHFNMFRGPALQTHGTGFADTIHTILAINCCLDRAATADVGVMDIGGNDHWIYGVEASASLTTGVSSPNLFINAWVIRGTNIFLSNCVGEFADRGYLITGAKNRFTGVRGDRNFGLGWETRGANNTFSACMAVDNHRSLATPTYPAVKTTGVGNKYAACQVTSTGADLPTVCFEDTQNTSAAASRNTYTGCGGPDNVPLFTGAGYLGSSFGLPSHPVRVTAGATIPVGQTCFHVLVYAAAETVTSFTGGHSGQVLTLLALNGNTTVAHGATIRTKTKANIVLAAEGVYRFTHYNGVWYEA